MSPNGEHNAQHGAIIIVGTVRASQEDTLKIRLVWLVGIAMLTYAGSSFAHHSHAYYADSGELVLEGTVQEFDWRNPHSWIKVLVRDEGSGEVIEWAFEGRSPGELSRQGWSPDSLAPGDEVAVRFRPLRNGGNGGLLRGVTLADGTVLLDD